MMDKNFRRVVQKADKYARSKDSICLFTGCQEKAIRSHAIPRASCIEALATNGKIFTLPQTLNSAMRFNSPSDPLEIVEVGVNEASVFRGYCPAHDTILFRSAETSDRCRKHGMFIAHHLRALSVEYCRRRFVRDFWLKASRLSGNASEQESFKKRSDDCDLIMSLFKRVYLDSLFNLIGGSDIDSIEYECIPFSRNLQVSCCGCLDGVPGKLDSIIGYNLLSYSDCSFLVLTTFTGAKDFLKDFLKNYPLPKHIEDLVNDIAFLHCEEPLISACLWKSLSEFEKLTIRYSIRHPAHRTEKAAPKIIKISPIDLVTNNSLSQAILARLPSNLIPAPMANRRLTV